MSSTAEPVGVCGNPGCPVHHGTTLYSAPIVAIIRRLR